MLYRFGQMTGRQSVVCQQLRRFSKFSALIENNNYFNELLSNPVYQNKCVGSARNFYTNALKKNKDNPDFLASLPQHPIMFSKPLSCLQPAEERRSFVLHPCVGDTHVNFEVELGVLLAKEI